MRDLDNNSLVSLYLMRVKQGWTIEYNTSRRTL